MLRLASSTAAVFTPMRADGELDCSRVPDYARLLSDEGVRSVFVCGTTGEFVSLTTQERRRVLEAWMEAKAAGLVDTVCVHVGSCCLKEAVELAEHAGKCKADAVAAMPPTFLPANDVDSVAEWLATVAAACPKVPFFIYHFPSLSNSRPDVRQLVQAVKTRVPTLAGMKFTDTQLPVAADCLEEGIQVLVGFEELRLAGMAVGATESIGISFNILPRAHVELEAAFNTGDFDSARRWQAQIRRLMETLRQCAPSADLVSAVKAAMSVCRIDLGPPRLPLRRLDEAETLEMKRGLLREKFFTEDQLLQ